MHTLYTKHSSEQLNKSQNKAKKIAEGASARRNSNATFIAHTFLQKCMKKVLMQTVEILVKHFYNVRLFFYIVMLHCS